jgi:hypothetical protein
MKDGPQLRQVIPSIIIALTIFCGDSQGSSCQGGTLGGPLTPGQPTLNDLFVGTARLQTFSESQEIGAPGDAGLAVIGNLDGGYLGFTRVQFPTGAQHCPGLPPAQLPTCFEIHSLRSSDGLSFTDTGAIFASLVPKLENILEPHVAIDCSVSPTLYVMTFQNGNSMWASHTTMPQSNSTWSAPVTVVAGGAPPLDASVGVALVDGFTKYVAWTELGPSKTISVGAQVASFDLLWGTTSDPRSVVMMDAGRGGCSSPWDCDNRDQHDWKREGSYYYVFYQGGREPTTTQSDRVGVARRANSPLAAAGSLGESYSERLPLARSVAAPEGIALRYPMLSVVDGKLYVYYAYAGLGQNSRRRARLVFTGWLPAVLKLLRH